MFRGCGCDVPWPIKSAAPLSWNASYCQPFCGFVGGRKACRSFGVASERFVEIFFVVVVLAKCKEPIMVTSLKKSFKDQGRIDVKLVTSKKNRIKFLN